MRPAATMPDAALYPGAGQMACPLCVVPLNRSDIFNADRWTPFANMLATLNDQERGQLRQMAIATNSTSAPKPTTFSLN